MNEVKSNKKWHFTQIENELLESELTIYQKMVYIALNSFVNKRSSSAYPSIKTLASMASCSDRKVSLVLKELEQMKYINIEYRNNQSSIYTLLEFPDLGGERHAPGGERHAPGGERHAPGGERGADELYQLNNNKITTTTEHIKDNAQLSLLNDVPTIPTKKLTKMEQAFIDTKEDFDRFYEAYPRPIGKKLAHEKFIKALEESTVDEIMNGTIRYAAYCKAMRTETNFIKHPSTFLNQQSYLDDYGGIGKAKQPIQYGDNLIPVTKKESENNVRENRQSGDSKNTTTFDVGEF